MRSLELVQRSMMQAIVFGPGHVPAGLFRGGRVAALRGLPVHANTISHARLVALEETYPRTRSLLGESRFNRLSRSFVESNGIGALPLAAIGRQFPDWLQAMDQSHSAIGLARFEWAWLQSYHAAEAPAFGLSDLVALGEAEISDLALACHPASAIHELDGEALAALEQDFTERFLLITRPDAEVRVAAVSPVAARLHAAFELPSAVCNLLAEWGEPGGEQALLALIAAGALIRIGESCPPC